MRSLTRTILLLTVTILGLQGLALAAQPIDNQALLEEIRALRAKVAEMDAMEKRLTELEALVAGQPARSAETTVTTTLDESSRPLLKEVVAEVFDEKRPIHVGGALRVNYGYKDWDDRQDETFGDFAFDLFRLNLDGEIGNWLLSAEYRFYPEYDFHTIHHGYVGYNINDAWQVQAGIHQVPFGLQPYASHNFWFSGAYYVGLEDDYDMGVKGLYEEGPLQLALAFYKNGELGSASNTDRYSVDVTNNAAGGYAGAQADGNEETNQVNARLAYAVEHGEFGSSEFGVSGQWGQLYNSATDKTGDHWASALHMNGNYGNWNVQLEYATYEYDPENPAGFDDDIITMGGYSYSWGVPAEADLYIANVAYTIPVNRKWLDSITLYADNTLIEPRSSSQPTIWQNVVGALFASGPVYTYLDVISGENMIFSGGNMVDKTDAKYNERTTRVNLNVGYYW